MDEILDVLRPATDHITTTPNVSLQLSTDFHSVLNTHSTVEGLEIFGGKEVERAGKAETRSRQKPCKQTQYAQLYSDLLQA